MLRVYRSGVYVYDNEQKYQWICDLSLTDDVKAGLYRMEIMSERPSANLIAVDHLALVAFPADHIPYKPSDSIYSCSQSLACHAREMIAQIKAIRHPSQD